MFYIIVKITKGSSLDSLLMANLYMTVNTCMNSVWYATNLLTAILYLCTEAGVP